jgi:hypothetical protein
MFSLLPWLFVAACFMALLKEDNPAERAIFAALGISECTFWFYAVRFGRKLAKITAKDSEV